MHAPYLPFGDFCHVRWGSFASFSPRPRHVRLSSETHREGEPASLEPWRSGTTRAYEILDPRRNIIGSVAGGHTMKKPASGITARASEALIIPREGRSMRLCCESAGAVN